MSSTSLQIEQKQRLLREALQTQSRLPLLSPSDKALYEQYATFRDVMKEQQKKTKNSSTLCRHLLGLYDEYISRLQKAYETMNEFDMELSPSYETADDSSLTTEELITKRKEYICWAERVGVLLREANEFPKRQTFFNQKLFYKCPEDNKFTELFTFNCYKSNYNLVDQPIPSTDASAIRNNCHCETGVCVGSLKVIVTNWQVNNFDNNPMNNPDIADIYPFDSSVYTELEISNISDFLHSFSTHLTAVYMHLDQVSHNRDRVAANLVASEAIDQTTVKTIASLDNYITELTEIDWDEINSLIQNGNELKSQLSRITITDSRLKFFSFK